MIGCLCGKPISNKNHNLKMKFDFIQQKLKQKESSRLGWAQLLVILGACVFLTALGLSAVYVPQLRVLHAMQALIYVAIIILARRNSPWGFGAGVIISIVWNCLSIFITHLFQAGANQLLSAIRTGQITRPDTLMVFVGGIGHFIIIFACLVAFIKSMPGKAQWAKFFGGGILALAYLALIVNLAPR
jgi:hypothetical protein